MIDILSLTSDDDNRIILRPIEGHPDCQREFINACYVDVSYITSLSPLYTHTHTHTYIILCVCPYIRATG